MPDLTTAIPIVRESVTAILRLSFPKAKKGKGQPKGAQGKGMLAGSAFCIVSDKYLLTAHHVLNGGNPRDTADKFYAFTVPQNGVRAYHFPVVGFPVERSDVDLAVLEIGPCVTSGIHIPSIPVTFAAQQDGSPVMTIGFPAPRIDKLNVDAAKNYRGGSFFLRSHANAGVVSANYDLGSMPVYELSVPWHHGESGGPIVTYEDQPAAFSVMQSYRHVESPHGIVAGPHCGRPLALIQSELTNLGATSI